MIGGRPRVGVLALQGDVIEHLRALQHVDAEPVRVRRPDDLRRLDGIVIPGGESTTIDRLARIFEVRDPLLAALRDGLPAYGTCAGMILLADRIIGGAEGQQTFGGMDLTVRRNAFGRQVDSFETAVDLDLGQLRCRDRPFRAVFIRAPRVEAVGPGVSVLGRIPGSASPDSKRPDSEGAIVAVRQGGLLATSFHPEVGGDHRVHAYFVQMLRSAG